jgi:formylglycine-generating enzyme required for sulfatase activity
MYSDRIYRVLVPIIAIEVLCACVAIAADAPPAKVPPHDFAGTKAGQLRSDNGLKTKLIWCPPGSFMLGRAEDEDEMLHGDQVSVTLSTGFWLGQHEVTQAEWQRVMRTVPWTGSQFVKTGDDYPATHVSWVDATKFCEGLTAQERRAGRLPDGWKYALPTEAQWEYACRAGTKTRYSFGNDESKLNNYAWFYDNAAIGNDLGPHRVGLKKANPWGLYDMHGNVWEWCRDYYLKEHTGGTDPTGPSEGTSRVGKGGSWVEGQGLCRSSSRYGFGPPDELRYDNLGFRVAAVPSGR